MHPAWLTWRAGIPGQESCSSTLCICMHLTDQSFSSCTCAAAHESHFPCGSCSYQAPRVSVTTSMKGKAPIGVYEVDSEEDDNADGSSSDQESDAMQIQVGDTTSCVLRLCVICAPGFVAP